METKVCGVCKQEKPLSEFYPHKRDGYQSKCKACHKQEMKLLNRTPKRRAYNKKYYDQYKKSGYFQIYAQKPEVKKRKAESMRIYSQDPRLRVRFLARWYARKMTENGTIIQQPCAFCGNPQSERHHPDYTQPLLIVWLCEKCHRELHKIIKKQWRESKVSPIR